MVNNVVNVVKSSWGSHSERPVMNVVNSVRIVLKCGENVVRMWKECGEMW